MSPVTEYFHQFSQYKLKNRDIYGSTAVAQPVFIQERGSNQKLLIIVSKNKYEAYFKSKDTNFFVTACGNTDATKLQQLMVDVYAWMTWI